MRDDEIIGRIQALVGDTPEAAQARDIGTVEGYQQ
jgi:hypothetical protein